MQENAEQSELTGAVPSVGFRLSLFYGALFLGLGIFVPFFPVWLREQGLDVAQISVVLACQMAVRIGSGPAFSFLADRLGDQRSVLIGLSCAALLTTLLLSVASGFVAILCLAALASIVWTPILPLTEALAVMESEAGGADYGRTRLWGSLGFIAGSVGGGYTMGITGADFIVWMLVGSYLLMAASSFWLPRNRKRKSSVQQKIRFGDALPVLRHPVFLAFLGAASLIQASHAFYYGFGTLQWQEAGIADDVIGALWAVGVIAEVVLFIFAQRSLKAAGPVGLIVLGGAAAVLRWCLTALDPGVAWLVAIQVSHALTFGATHLGAMHFIARATPSHVHATVQGVHSAVAGGIVMAIAMWGAGALYAAYGVLGYFAMAGLGLSGTVFAVFVAVRWRGGELVQSNERTP